MDVRTEERRRESVGEALLVLDGIEERLKGLHELCHNALDEGDSMKVLGTATFSITQDLIRRVSEVQEELAREFDYIT